MRIVGTFLCGLAGAAAGGAVTAGTAGADQGAALAIPCKRPLAPGRWQPIPEMPGAGDWRRERRRAQNMHNRGKAPPTAWRGGRLLVTTGPGEAMAFDPCARQWSSVSPAELEGTPGAMEPRLALPKPRDPKAARVELETGRVTPRAYLELATFAGARLRIDGGAWIPLPEKDAPAPRRRHVVLLVDRGLLVWGGETESGLTDQGALFDVRKRRWIPTSAPDAPSPRDQVAVALWTGSAAVVWGGSAGSATLSDGALYDPAANRWTPMSAEHAPAAERNAWVLWSGRFLAVLGLERGGAIYDPAANRWRPLPPSGRPSGPKRFEDDAPRPMAWRIDDRRLLVALTPWLAVLDLAAGSWSEIRWRGRLSRRTGARFHVDGDRLIIFSGVRRRVIRRGSGCDGPEQPDAPKCDPIGPSYDVFVPLDGVIHRLAQP